MAKYHAELTIAEVLKDVEMKAVLLRHLPKLEVALPGTRFMTVPIEQIIPCLRKSQRKENLIVALEELKTL